MMDLGTIIAKMTVDTTQFTKGLDKANAQLSGLVAMAAAVEAVLVGTFVAAAEEGLRFSSQLEQLDVAFTTFLGSSEKSADFLNQMKQFAAQTPFQFEDVTKGAQKLMALGFAAEDTIPLLSAIGDRMSSLGAGAQDIDRTIRALGQMAGRGMVVTQEMNQLTEVGIRAWDILAKEVGVSTMEIRGMVEGRMVDSATFLKAFMHSTSAEVGGMMQKQSKTLTGLVSTLKDNISITLADVFTPLRDALKPLVLAVGEAMPVFLGALGPLVDILSTLSTWIARVVQGFNLLAAPVQQFAALTTMAVLAGIAGFSALILVLAGVSATIAAIVSAFAPLASALAAVLAPEILVPILGALAAGAAVAAGAVTLFFGAFGQEGEAAWDTLNRIGTNLTGVLAPALALTQQIGESLIAGFQAGFIKFPLSLDHVTASLVAVTNQMLDLLATIAGNDLGASKWEVVGGWVARLTAYLLTLGTDVLALVMDQIVAITSVFGPLIAAVSRFGEGLFGLVTGTKDVGDAFWDMGAGILGALGSILNAVMALVFTTIATVADAAALAMDAVPGTGSMSAGLKGVGADMRATATTMANELTSAIVGSTGLDITASTTTFNMELDAASVSTGGFNMEVDAARNKMSSYAHSLDKMVGALSGVTKAARAPKTPEVPKAPELPPILPGPGIEVGSDYGAVMQGLFDLKPYEQVIGMEITSLIESMRSAAFNGESNLNNDEIGYFAAKIEEAQAKLDAYNEGLEKSKKVVDFYNHQLWKLADAGLGKLGSTIQDAISGVQTGGVWGALVAVLVDLLVSSETMADITATLDRSFGQISNVFGKLLGGVHVVVGNVLNVVAAFVGIFEPLFEHVAKAFAGFGAGLYTLAFIFESLSGLMQVLMAPMQMLEPLLSVAFEAFFSLMQFVGVILLTVVLGIQKAWNWILGVLADALEWIGAKDAAANLEGYMADTTATQDALSTLMNTTYEQAQAQSELVVSVDAVTESMNSMVNIPTLFKTALVAFQSADTSSKFSIPAFATGGLVSGPTVALIGEAGPEAVVPLRSKNPGALAGLMGGGGGNVTIFQVHIEKIVTDDVEGLAEELERYAARKQVQRKGTPLLRPGRFSTR